MSEWVRVGDRLPETGKSVLICGLDFYGIGYFKEDCWYSPPLMLYSYEIAQWMPLPDLPEEI